MAIAVLLVSSKLEDTLKKLRDIQIAAYQIKAAQDGANPFTEPDQQILDGDRARLIGIERLILETISFNFNLRSSGAYPTREASSPSSRNQDVFAYVLKLGRVLGGECERGYPYTMSADKITQSRSRQGLYQACFPTRD